MEAGRKDQISRMRIILYGIGKRYLQLFDDDRFEMWLKNRVEIIGFADGDNAVWGKEIFYEERIYKIKGIESFCRKEYESILITSKKNFESIKAELVTKGYESKNILIIDRFIELYLDEIYNIKYFNKKTGIEIGGPSELFTGIYSKCTRCDGVNFSIHTVWCENIDNEYKYKDMVMGNMFIADATDMSRIEDEKYDFVLSSNNLEHIANPIKALKEFVRLVKWGGVVLIIVPMKEKTFDHDREYTTFNHLLEDYLNDVREDDLTHLSEIIEKHDYDMNISCGGKEKFIERAKKNVENRCLHHHVFAENGLKEMFKFVGLKVLNFTGLWNNWLIMGQKQ
jgi:SAM-dependent methyltransferase